MPLSQSLHLSSRLAASQSSTTLSSRDFDSRLPLLRTSNSQPVDRPRPASSLGFRGLFRSLGPSSRQSAKAPTVTRLRSPASSTPTTPSFPSSFGQHAGASPSPLTRSFQHTSTRSSYHSRNNISSSSPHAGPGNQRAVQVIAQEKRNPKWKTVEAEWRMQARTLQAPHKESLLGAVCIDIRDPLDQMTADILRSYVKGRSRRPTTQDPATPRTRPPTSSMQLKAPRDSLITPTPSSLRRNYSIRSRQMLDRPRPVKRRCKTPEPFRTAHPLTANDDHEQLPNKHPLLEVRKRAHSMPFEGRSGRAPTYHQQTRIVDTPNSPWSIVAPPYSPNYGQSTDGDTTPKGWTMITGMVHRSPSPSEESTIRARKKMLERLEQVTAWTWQVIPNERV